MLQPQDTDWLKGYKTRPTYMLSTRNPLQTLRHIQTESERMENIFHANRKQKKAGVEEKLKKEEQKKKKQKKKPQNQQKERNHKDLSRNK